MAVSRGKFLKSLGKSIPGMVLGGGITTAAQKVLGKVAAVSGEPAIPSAPADPATVKVEPVEFIKQGPAEGNRIALTFDDGPTPGVTDLILDELKQRGLRATFFMIGNGITAAPDLARRVLVEGHEVGNHTLTHPKLTALPDAQVEAEVDKTQEIIRDVLVPPKKRLATKPTRASKERRLVGKQQRGKTKQNRSRQWSPE